jgi:large subunit ribosomal protein L15
MLERLKPRPGAVQKRKRVARGPGSGIGKTAGRGTKGQGHRSSGREVPIYSEGGQMPLTRRLPKRGFRSPAKKTYRIVNLAALSVFGEGATVDVAALQQRGLIQHTQEPVKLLAEGEAPRNLTITVHAASASAQAKVSAAGGRVELLA